MQQNPSSERVCNGSLRIICSLRDLQFSKLIDVYSESLGLTAGDSSQGRLDAEQDLYAFLRIFLENGFYGVWEEDGRYLSALRLEPYKDGLLLEAVETDPNFRNQGHAKKLMRAILAYVGENQRCPVYSHVKKDNAGSLALHKSCGFRQVSDCASYVDGSASWDACTFCYP